MDRILVAVDFSDASKAALVTAARLARRSHAAVDLLHVWQGPPEGERSAAEADMVELRAFLASLGAFPDRELLAVGDPATEIVALAREGDYDLVVMGTSSRRGLARAFLGSVAEKVLRHATCPVLTVHAGDTVLGEQPQVGA